jgi:hypothetical protein
MPILGTNLKLASNLVTGIRYFPLEFVYGIFHEPRVPENI